MKYLILSVLLCAGFFLRAQENIDVVKLHSGAVYKGVISEYIPDESVTIKLADGRVMSFTADEVASVNSVIDGTEPPGFEVKEKGYFHTSGIGFQVGRGNYSYEVSFAYNTVNGYKYGPSNFGIGTGVETYLQDLYIPLFVDYTHDFLEGSFSPYVSGQLGYAFSPASSEAHLYYSEKHLSGGFLAGMNMGVKTYLNRNFGLILSLGYRYYELSGESSYWLPDDHTYSVQHLAQLHRFNVSIGILLN